MISPRPADLARGALVAAGVAAMGWGLRGIVVEAERTHPASFVTWFVGSIVVHDGLIAPMVCAAGTVVARRLRPPYRAVVQAGLIVSGVVLLVSIPVVGGFGRRADNSSTLPLDYPRNLVVVLAVSWLVVAALLLRRRPRPRGVRRATAPR